MSKLTAAIEALRHGGIIAYPTEAVYGLGCDPLNEAAVIGLLALKKRPVSKGLILIAATVAQIAPYIGPVPIAAMQRVLATWPGPVTWVFPATALVPAWIRGAHSTVAVRVTAHPPANALCVEFGRPLVSTSANLAGHPPARDLITVQNIFPAAAITAVAGAPGNLTRPTEIRLAVNGEIMRSA